MNALTYLKKTIYAGAAAMLLATGASAQPASPGPYGILPFADAYIVEAFMDLRSATSDRADWTGWSHANTWVSPNAYNNHGGTDFSVGTGTPVYATTAGTVVEVVNNIPENNHTLNYYGNYVKIAASGTGPKGQALTVLTAHMLPSIVVTVGQTVTQGQLVGYSDNTGNSTSEHVHVESTDAGTINCPFYHGHWRYPIMFNPNAKVQVGHIIKVKASSTPIRSDMFPSSSQLSTAHQGQLYFASFAKRGYYRVFIPNDGSNRSGWIRALDVEEVYDEGTVIQPLADAGAYVHATQLASIYPVRSAANAGAGIVGYVRYAGGRFVADQTAPGNWYRIPVPGATDVRGWVQADNKMIVYPERYNPDVNLATRPQQDFPFAHSLTTPAGMLDFGRPKFDRCSIVYWDAPGTADDGNAFLLTDAINTGSGAYETMSFGRPQHRNYYVQADVYFRFDPSYLTGNNYERYGIFVRDDGFGGWDQTFEGAGNCYALTWDSDDGRLRCARITNGTSVVDFLPSVTYVTAAGWHTMRIEARDNEIKYYLDNLVTPLRTVTDTTFESGLFGMAYSWKNPGGNYPAARGGYFRNFQADALPGASVTDWALY